MGTEELPPKDILVTNEKDLMLKGKGLPETVLSNALKNKITIIKPENYKLKERAYEYILTQRNTTADILTTHPFPNQFLGELIVFLPRMKSLEFLFHLLQTGVITQNLLKSINIKHLNSEKFPCSFFIGHMAELDSWKNFTEPSFLGYPKRELSLNLHCTRKSFKFHTEAVYE
jgi:hypothetical protein